MKRIFQIFLGAIVIAAGWTLWIWSHPAPEKAIRKQMEKLAESLASRPGEGNIARVSGINRTLSVFTTDIQINGEGIAQVSDTISGKTELQQALFAARARLDGEIRFHDLQIQVAGETNATAIFTAVARLAGQSEPYAQDLKARWQKVNGEWLIAQVDASILRVSPGEEK